MLDAFINTKGLSMRICEHVLPPGQESSKVFDRRICEMGACRG